MERGGSALRSGALRAKRVEPTPQIGKNFVGHLHSWARAGFRPGVAISTHRRGCAAFERTDA